jgi:serine/threonine-protein kinase
MPGSAVSDLAGRVLAHRYLLHNAIGTGASGRVYVADDTRLRRRVAVKVLHAALAEDAAFLRRFRAEAQLAASLHHPHIVTVHDWGEDDVPFMVLELLEGGSLRAMLDQGTRLSVPQAARVGRDVASALDYAHRRGVLHRDIKPANLLFDEHGIVRVADFGLARALAEASWTEPAGAMFGTARYASPEQASGVQLDGRSDLYSLALVMVESVTGDVPFAAETTLGTLAARTQRPLTAPAELGPLAPVIDRAGAVEPADRYPDAATMRAAIADAGDALPPPAPLVLAGMSDKADPHPTRAVPSRNTRLFDQDAPDDIRVIPEPTVANAIVVDEDDDTPSVKPNMQRRLVPFVVAIVLLITVAIATAALARVSGASPIPIPNFVGLTQDQAVTLARAQHIDVSYGSPQAKPDPAGTVVSQSPGAGASTSSHHVKLVLSSGPPDVTVPQVVGKSWNDARALLDGAGLVYGQPKQRYDDVAPVNTVLEIDPNAGTLLKPDNSVIVWLSAGHKPVNVPDVSNMPFDQASQQLSALHFNVKQADQPEFSSTVPKDQVTRTDPPAGKDAPYGSNITVYVSKGPDLVLVPNVTNLTLQQAQAKLAASGLKMAVKGSVGNGDLVQNQDTSPGQEVPRGSTVTVTFSSGQTCFLGICF